MSYKTVLTHVEPDWGSARALQAAIEVANMFSAHLIGVAAQNFDGASYAYGDGGLIQAMRDQISLDAASAENRFRAAAGAAHSGASFVADQAYPAEAVSNYARGADLVIARRVPRGSGSGVLCHPADLLATCGVPVLIAPESPEPLQAKRVLIAWRDGHEARRALADSLPFLKRADQVMLATVRDKDEDAQVEVDLKQVAQRLARHTVSVSLNMLPAGHGEASSKLIDAAHRFNADLIVAGAYSHMRLSEQILGGVTQDLLEACSKYVLFSR